MNFFSRWTKFFSNKGPFTPSKSDNSFWFLLPVSVNNILNFLASHLKAMSLSLSVDEPYEGKQTYRWSWRLNAFEHTGHTYFLSSLCVNLCFARALELLKAFPHTGHDTPLAPPGPPLLAGRPFPLGLSPLGPNPLGAGILAESDEDDCSCCPEGCCWALRSLPPVNYIKRREILLLLLFSVR